MKKILYTIAWGGLFGAQLRGQAAYLKMAPVEQYLMERSEEIALARSAAPESISANAEILVLGRHGFETAVRGGNGFTCVVERSWSAGIDDPDFWSPWLRAPICFNPPGARFNLAQNSRRTELVLAGRSKEQMFEEIRNAYQKKHLPAVEPGAMCFMLSKRGHLSERDGHWLPHLMFFVPQMEAASWGTGLPGSPVAVAFVDPAAQVSVFLVPVGQWSDGSAAAGPALEKH